MARYSDNKSVYIINHLQGLQVWGWVVGMENPLTFLHDATGKEDQQHTVGLVLSVLPVFAFILATICVVYIYRVS